MARNNFCTNTRLVPLRTHEPFLHCSSLLFKSAMPLSSRLPKGLIQALRTRCYSQQALSGPSAATSSAPHAPLAAQSTPQHPYFVPRNSRGSLPVYSDIRNGGTRYLVLVRNVHGNINVSKAPAPSLRLPRPRTPFLLPFACIRHTFLISLPRSFLFLT